MFDNIPIQSNLQEQYEQPVTPQYNVPDYKIMPSQSTCDITALCDTYPDVYIIVVYVVLLSMKTYIVRFICICTELVENIVQ